MRTANPAFIPRNHLVEEAIQAAITAEDFGLFNRLVDVLAKPYDDQPDAGMFALPPRPRAGGAADVLRDMNKRKTISSDFKTQPHDGSSGQARG